VPVLFVHGVAIREEDDPEYAAVERLTRGAEWVDVEAALREHVAPVLRPAAPERVELLRVYWGDLGARIDDPVEEEVLDVELAALDPEALGEQLQARLFEQLPPAHWPAVVRAVWGTVHEPAMRAQLAARSAGRQRRWLEKQVRDRLAAEAPELTRGLTPIVADVAASNRRTVRRAMGEMRKPFHAFVPVFVGDVLRYLDGRGRPGEPGPIMDRLLAGLDAAGAAVEAAAEHGVREPLVVLSHSMGGQLVYDALTAFADARPARVPRVDLWCASGGQLGLFAELGMFLTEARPAIDPIPADRLGYLWNAWSSSDVLSFPAAGRVAGAHDSDFAYPGTVATTHTAYLKDPAFFRTLAAKVQMHAARGRHTVHRPDGSGATDRGD